MECLWYPLLFLVYMSYFVWNKTFTSYLLLLVFTSVFHIFRVKTSTWKTISNHSTSWCWIHVNDIELKRDIANCHRVGVNWRWLDIQSLASLSTSTLFVKSTQNIKHNIVLFYPHLHYELVPLNTLIVHVNP